MANPVLWGGYASPQSIYELSTDQHHQIGTVGTLTGGRVYYYGRYQGSATTAAGKLMVASSRNAANEDLATATTALKAGSPEVTGITLGTVAVGSTQKFHYLDVIDGGGEGLSYRIKSHPTAAASATNFSMTLYDNVAVASDANTQVTLRQDLYADFVISVADALDVPVGVACVAMVDSSTTARYCWIQSYGPGVAFVNGTPGVGTPLGIGDTTVGNLDPVPNDGTPAWTGLHQVVAFMDAEGNTDDEVTTVDWRIRGA
jgi:hypothetical protein